MKPELFAKCVPGFEQIQKIDDETYRAKSKISVGFISARFEDISVRRRLDDAVIYYDVKGEDSRKLGAFALTIAVTLTGDGQTLVRVDSDLDVTGKFATLGIKIVEHKFKGLIADTVKNFQAMKFTDS